MFVATVLALTLLTVDAAEEGRKIIIAMTLVGLTFLVVIALGELAEWLARRRGE